MSFNLDNYETVDSRIKKFYDKYPDGRIITNLDKSSDDYSTVIFKAIVYKDKTEVISGTGYALEVMGQGFVNKTSWVENCETSAIGRALANIGLSGENRPSREEMAKSQEKEVDKDSLLGIIKTPEDFKKLPEDIKVALKDLKMTSKQILELLEKTNFSISKLRAELIK